MGVHRGHYGRRSAQAAQQRIVCNSQGGTTADDTAQEPRSTGRRVEEPSEHSKVQKHEDGVMLGMSKAAGLPRAHLRLSASQGGQLP